MALTRTQVKTIIMMRGFGYKQSEIADRLGVSLKTIVNHLARLNQEAVDAGEDIESVFWRYMIDADSMKTLLNLVAGR